MFGILVIGAPGAGKSTFCAGLSQIFEQLNRRHYIVNLDPANDSVQYTIDLDIKELITVQEVMDRLGLGPNGALKYCIDTLCHNEQWLIDNLLKNKDKYLVIDCPGQLELYKSEADLHRLIRSLEKNGIRLCAVNLSDSLYCGDAAKFISVIFSTLAVMVTLEMPQINILSKMDLFNMEKSFDLDFFTRLPDVTKLLELLNDAPGLERYKALNDAICQTIADFDLVSFTPLNVSSKESMAQVIKQMDIANGYSLYDQDIRELVLEMGLFSHLVTMSLGFYGGLWAAQNYEIGQVPSVSQLVQRLEDYLSQHKKDDK